jgi:thioredoxin-related protein
MQVTDLVQLNIDDIFKFKVNHSFSLNVINIPISWQQVKTTIKLKRMRQKLYFLLFFLNFFILFLAQAQDNRYSTITGRLQGFSDSTLIRLYAISGRLEDSAYLNKGRFILHKKFTKQATPYGFRLTNDTIDINKEIFLGNENVVINCSYHNFDKSFKLTGSPNHNLLVQMDNILADVLQERKNLLAEYLKIRQSGNMTDSIRNIYWGQAGSIKMLDDEALFRQKKFINQNINSYYALYLLSIIKTDYDKKELQSVVAKLNSKYKHSNYANAIFVSLKNKELAVGDKYIEFTAFDRKNETNMFSNFFGKGKYILLDFSTPYCQFCLSAIEPLKQLAATHHKELEIVTFYVDEEKNGYQTFLDATQKPWKVLWDKKGRFGDAFSAYNIGGTPTFFLFDKDGKLILKQDGYSEDFFKQATSLIK